MIEGSGGLLGAEAALKLSRLGAVQIERGLTETELVRVEGQFGFEFADDHRAFLSRGLPVGRGWPDWRYGDSNRLRATLEWPVDGVLFDVEHETFWHESWGELPADLGEAMAVAREQLGGVPQMVPVYGHRYLPSGRGTFGHPVLSMYQADIVCYVPRPCGLHLSGFRHGKKQCQDNRFVPAATSHCRILVRADLLKPLPTLAFSATHVRTFLMLYVASVDRNRVAYLCGSSRAETLQHLNTLPRRSSG